MAMRVLCVYSVGNYVDADRPLDSPASIPFGLSYISAVLHKAGHEVTTLVVTPDTSLYHVLSRIIGEFRPHLLGLTSVSTQFPLISTVAEIAKSIDPGIYTIVGGPHPSLSPDEAIACEPIDAICVGEGEVAVAALARRLDAGEQPTAIRNIWFKRRHTGEVEKNPTGPLIGDLDGLPFIDRGLWKPWILDTAGTAVVLVGRGCPNRCSYCSNHALRSLAPGRYVRFRSPANIVTEVTRITQDRSVTGIYFEVETIAASMSYALAFAAALKDLNASRDGPLPFGMNMALNRRLMRDESRLCMLLDTFRDANVRELSVGLESGSPRIRNEVLRRPHYSNEEFIAFCAKARDRGIDVSAYVMLGLPQETPSDWAQTIDVLRRGRPKSLELSIFYPYPGTDLYRNIPEDQLRTAGAPDGRLERRRAVLVLPNFSRARVLLEFVLCEFKVYRGHWSVIQRCFSVVRRVISVFPSLGKWFFVLTRKTWIGRAMLGMARRMERRTAHEGL